MKALVFIIDKVFPTTSPNDSKPGNGTTQVQTVVPAELTL